MKMTSYKNKYIANYNKDITGLFYDILNFPTYICSLAEGARELKKKKTPDKKSAPAPMTVVTVKPPKKNLSPSEVCMSLICEPKG